MMPFKVVQIYMQSVLSQLYYNNTVKLIAP